MSKLDEFNYHEILDRTSLITDLFSREVGNSRVIEKHENLQELSTEIEKKLGGLYQEIGRIRFKTFSKD